MIRHPLRRARRSPAPPWPSPAPPSAAVQRRSAGLDHRRPQRAPGARSRRRRGRPPMSRATATATRARRSPSSASGPATRSSRSGPAAAGTPRSSRPTSLGGGGTYHAASMGANGNDGVRRLMAANARALRRHQARRLPGLGRGRDARPRRQRRRRPHLPQRPQLADGLSAGQPALQRRGVPPDLCDAAPGRHARRGRPPPARKRRRRARADQRLRQGLDRPPARRGGRLPPRRRVRDQRQSARHGRLAATASGRCRRRCASARRTASAISRSAKATA